MKLSLVVDSVAHQVPGFKVEYMPGVKEWCKRNGYSFDRGRHSNYLHYPTGRQLQLFSWFNAEKNSYALETVVEASYITSTDVVEVLLDFKLTTARYPVSMLITLENENHLKNYCKETYRT